MDTDTVAVGVGAATASSVLTGLGAWIVNLLKTRHDQDRQVRKDTIEELYRLNEQLRKEIDTLEAKCEKIAKKHLECQVQYSRMLERVENYELALTNANVPFRPYRPGNGTDNHPSLPPTGGK